MIELDEADQAAWDAWESGADAAAEADLRMVRQMLLACATRAREAHAELERRADELVRAREAAEASLARVRATLDVVEDVARVLASEDVERIAELARQVTA